MSKIYAYSKTPPLRSRRKQNRLLRSSYLLLAGIVMLTAILSKHSMPKQDWLYSPTWHFNMPIRQLQVNGNNHLLPLDILKSAQITQSTNLATLNLKDVKVRLEQNGWIERAEIRRIIPDTLILTIHESVPQAVWWHNKQAFLVSQQGKVIDKINSIKEYKQYIVMFGEHAPKEYTKIYEILYRCSFFSDILSISWVGNRRWDVYLRNKSIIKFPEHADENGVKMAETLLRDSIAQDKPISLLDLRLFPEKVFVKNYAKTEK